MEALIHPQPALRVHVRAADEPGEFGDFVISTTHLDMLMTVLDECLPFPVTLTTSLEVGPASDLDVDEDRVIEGDTDEDPALQAMRAAMAYIEDEGIYDSVRWLDTIARRSVRVLAERM